MGGRSPPAARGPSAARGAAWGWGLIAALHARGVAEGTFQEGGPNMGLSALCSFSCLRVGMSGEMGEELSILTHD